jgi:hypothetical protein
MAAVSQTTPQWFDCRLNASEQCSRRGGHVLDEQEPSTRLQNPENFADRSLLIYHAAKNECTDGEIYAGALEWQVLRSSQSQIDVDSETLSFLPEMSAHIAVGFHTDPLNALRQHMTQVRPGPGTNLQDGSGEIGEQPRFIWREISVSLVPTPGHKPGKYPQANRARASAELSTGDFSLVGRLVQHSDYTALLTRPP